jgi:hypothetical protein
MPGPRPGYDEPIPGGAGDEPEAQYLRAIIDALEIMRPEQREKWKRHVVGERDAVEE